MDESFLKGIQEARTEIKGLLTDFKKLAKEARDISKGVQAAKTFDDLSKKAAKAGKSIKDLTAEEKKLESANKRLAFAQSEAGKAYAKTTEEIRRQNKANKDHANSQLTAIKNTNRWGNALKSFQFKFNALGNLIATATATVFRAFLRTIKQSVDVVKNFDSTTARLASVLGKTKDEISDLTKEAKELGSITQFTASQVTGLQIELAKLGFTANEISNATPGILNFATATGADLADAAKTAGVAVRAFGLDTLETETAVATLAVATTKSALTFADYETILSTLGPVAKAYGFTLEDTVALTGKLKDAGFDANKAATATRNILLNLADANGDLAKSLGGSVNNFDDLIDGMIQLDKEGISLAKSLELTDKRSVAAFNQFLETAEGARELRDSITGVNGQLQDMVDTQLDTLAGDVDLLKSAWEGLILAMSDGGILREAVQLLTNAVLQVSNLDLATTKFHKQNAQQIARSFDLLSSLTNRQGEAFSAVVEQFEETPLAEIMLNEEAIIEQFNKVRKVNKKEAKALFDEFVRQRQEAAQKEIEIEIAKNERIAEEHEKAAKKQRQSYEDVSEQLKQLKKEETEALKEEDQDYQTAYSEAWDTVEKNTEGVFENLEGLVQNQFDLETEKIQEQTAAWDEYYAQRLAAENLLKDVQIEAANEGFNFISAILDRKAAKIDQQLKDEVISEEQAAEEKRKLQKKAAIVDKAQALFNIALNTALGVSSAAASVVTIPLIPWIIGLGAAQAAVVLAEPIPAFKEGTSSAPGGPAVVGEEGHELMIGPDGKIGLTPSDASLMDIKKGTEIIPADVTAEIMKYAAVASGLGSRANDTKLIVEMMARIDESTERLRRELKNKPVASSILTPAGILTSTHKGNTTIKKMRKFFG